jgi:transcriptional regulator GlxA family with amidase domain
MMQAATIRWKIKVVRRLALYSFAFALPPLLVSAWLAASTLSDAMVHRAPAPLAAEPAAASRPAITVPKSQPGKLTAVILLSNAGTQLTDLLGPFEALAASGFFHVVTAAPLKQLSPTTGPVAVLPDFALAEAPRADLIVIPAVVDPSNTALTRWIREQAPAAKLVLSVCEGARLAAEAGLLNGKKVTSHFMAIAELKSRHPSTTFIEGARYVADGALASSAGITGSIDGALYAVARLKGEAVALETAHALGYTWNRPGKEPAAPPPSVSRLDFMRVLANAAFHWRKRQVAVLLYPGVSELGVASFLETLPRTFASRVVTVSEERRPIFTRHGLRLVATDSAATLLPPELLIIPSGHEQDPLKFPWVDTRVREQNIAVKSFFYDPPGKAYDQSLDMLAQLDGEPITRLVARIIEYPWAGPVHQDAPLGGLRPLEIAVKILVLGLAGMLLTWTVERRVSRKR